MCIPLQYLISRTYTRVTKQNANHALHVPTKLFRNGLILMVIEHRLNYHQAVKLPRKSVGILVEANLVSC